MVAAWLVLVSRRDARPAQRAGLRSGVGSMPAQASYALLETKPIHPLEYTFESPVVILRMA
jgi:hypothetical protein